jgi:hypothetical protein
VTTVHVPADAGRERAVESRLLAIGMMEFDTPKKMHTRERVCFEIRSFDSRWARSG